LERTEEGKYKVIITIPAEKHFYELLDYFYEHYPLDRAEEIANELRSTAKSLEDQPERGSLEIMLSNRQHKYRYILHRRTPRADVKIIYYVNIKINTVYITDFFPTEKDNRIISERN
jgi:plasmid stabilization system protein ParE